MTYLKAKIQRYDTSTGNSTEGEIVLPSHVTRTGTEDHFDLAYHDTQMIIAGMRLLDGMLGIDHDKDGKAINVIYRILSIS